MINKTRVKIGIVVVITCVMSFSDWGFAAEETEVRSIAWLTDVIISVLSWGWVLLAKLAGEFLTNKWVYGELLGLDALLRQYWNIVKNIANFCLGFYFMYIIFGGLIKQGNESLADMIKHKILWILVSGIGIQVSWFFTAAMIDVSTITLVAAGSLPAQIIAENGNVQKSYENSLSEYFHDDGVSQDIIYGRYISLFDPSSDSGKFIKSANVPLQEPVSKNAFFDSLLPSADTVSGPLYYMGFSILNVNDIGSLNSSSERSLKGSLLNLIVVGGTIVIYSLEMVVLCVLALMRIIYLWMFIVLSPLAIFLWCLQMSKDDKVLKLSFVDTLTKQINIKSFFINIFKPTIIVIGLGLATIFVALMKGLVIENTNKSIDLGGVVISTTKMNTENSSDSSLFTSTMDSGLIKFTIGYVGKGLLDFIMSIMAVILVYIIINFAVKFGEGKDFVSDKIKSVQKAAGGLFTALPVMPVSGYDEEGVATTRYMSMGKVFGVDENMKSNGTGGLLGAKIGQYQGGITDEYSRQNAVISSLFGENNDKIKEFKSVNQTKVTQIGNTAAANRGGLTILQEQMKEIRRIGEAEGLKAGEGYGMTLNPLSDISFWRKEFEKWLSTVDKDKILDNAEGKTWKAMIDWRKDENNPRDLGKMFKVDEPNRVKAYVKFFGLDSSITKWEDLKNADISEKKEE